MSNIKITKQQITDVLKKNYMPYAMSVIISRALPDIDGFKPSHRKLRYTMYKMGLLKGNRTKSANIVGQTMRLNPHGDSAIYETMVRLSKGNESLLHPYVDSKGNFGKTYSKDMAYAASRYTEAKLEAICNELFDSIEKDTVDFVDNYDSTMKEPSLLPVTFPNILVNPNICIAVGLDNNICSFNLKEICYPTIAYIEDQEFDITKKIKGPDFPTGAKLIYNEDVLNKVFEEGQGTFKLRAKYKVSKKDGVIEIFEIPYTTNVETIIDRIVGLIKKNQVKEITDIRDETDLKGLKITLDIKKTTNVKQLMAKLYKLTPLEDTFSCNFNYLVDGNVVSTGVKGIIENWYEFRVRCIKNQLQYDIKAKNEKLHLLYGLEKILMDIDKAIKIVRESEKDKDVIPNLMDGFDIDRKQAEFIAEIKLRNLNKEYILNRTKDIKDLEEEVADLEKTLKSKRKTDTLIIEGLKSVIRKYGQDRKTEIVHEDDVVTFDHEDIFIEDYNLKVFLTKEGYFKKISLVSLRASSAQKLKDKDEIIQEIDATNKSELMVFTNQTNVYKMKLYDINDHKASMMGEYLQSLFNFNKDEKPICIVVTQDYKGHMLFCFENGKCAKVPLKSYMTKTNRKKLTRAYDGDHKLIGMFFLQKDIDLVAVSDIGKILVFNSSNVTKKSSKTAKGILVMKPKKGSVVNKVISLDDINFKDKSYYETKNLPAMGFYLKKEDRKYEKKLIGQISLLEGF